MSRALDKGREAFRVEACELLEELEASLLKLEENPDDKDLIGRVFRAMHTLKGSGGMFGFENIESFTHHIESALDRVRNGEIAVNQNLIDLTLATRDQIKQMLESTDDGSGDQVEQQRILNEFMKLLPEFGKADASQNSQNDFLIEDGVSLSSFHIRFRPKPHIFSFGTNPLLLLKELCDLGECRIIGDCSGVPDLKKIIPDNSYLGWNILLKTSRHIHSIQDVFIFVEDDCDLEIKMIDDGTCPGRVLDIDLCASLLVENEDLTPENINKCMKDADPSSSAAKKSETKSDNSVDSAAEKNKESAVVSSIRVASEKLDSLVDLVGELVIAQARLSQTVAAGIQNDAELIPISEELERLTSQLRGAAMDMRLVPVGALFNKFKRLVRDLSREQGKEIDLVIEGSETELDKTVIERLNDPLVHIIRNSIDHGIEPSAKRMFSGKSKTGTIHISAQQSGADVVISIQDDGAGIDEKAVLAKAIEKGLVQPDQHLSRPEILKLIFAAGFSTASQVTAISGRGVGMDVVKQNIDALRGSIDIKSEQGKGTSISLRLPLTLGIIEGLLVKISDNYYAFPLSVVEECVELIHKNGHTEKGRRLINLRDRAVPYISLREQFGLTDERPPFEQILVTKNNGQQVGFVVDQVIGEQQVVIKSLGRMYSQVEGISGATILGDGTVALILDVPKLAELAEIQENGE